MISIYQLKPRFQNLLRPLVQAADEANVHCYGVTSCKGMNDCKTAENACKGQAVCKGHGFKAMTQAACDAAGGKVGE